MEEVLSFLLFLSIYLLSFFLRLIRHVLFERQCGLDKFGHGRGRSRIIKRASEKAGEDRRTRVARGKMHLIIEIGHAPVKNITEECRLHVREVCILTRARGPRF